MRTPRPNGTRAVTTESAGVYAGGVWRDDRWFRQGARAVGMADERERDRADKETQRHFGQSRTAYRLAPAQARAFKALELARWSGPCLTNDIPPVASQI